MTRLDIAVMGLTAILLAATAIGLTALGAAIAVDALARPLDAAGGCGNIAATAIAIVAGCAYAAAGAIVAAGVK